MGVCHTDDSEKNIAIHHCSRGASHLANGKPTDPRCSHISDHLSDNFAVSLEKPTKTLIFTSPALKGILNALGAMRLTIHRRKVHRHARLQQPKDMLWRGSSHFQSDLA
mmetsp:Transcript_175076/g.561452  ORF Transcript_175076/g.561452 Transcript_175076/m.561452 type:complete len:109 (-) Transcript_175076:155-481(-)